MSLRMDDFRCTECGATFTDVAYSWDTATQGPHATHAALDCAACGAIARVAWLKGRVQFTRAGKRTSSGEPLDRGTAYLAGLHFGPCVKDGDRMRPPRTEGELSQTLAKHNMHRGTVGQFNAMLEAKTEVHNAPDPAPAERSKDEVEKDLARIEKRREVFRSKYDAGEVPPRDFSHLPLEVRSQMPTPAAVTSATTGE